MGLAFGYGGKKGLQEEMQVGVNAFALYADANPVQTVSISAAEGYHEFACVQLHNTLMGRGDIVKETTLEALILRTATGITFQRCLKIIWKCL